MAAAVRYLLDRAIDRAQLALAAGQRLAGLAHRGRRLGARDLGVERDPQGAERVRTNVPDRSQLRGT